MAKITQSFSTNSNLRNARELLSRLGTSANARNRYCKTLSASGAESTSPHLRSYPVTHVLTLRSLPTSSIPGLGLRLLMRKRRRTTAQWRTSTRRASERPGRSRCGSTHWASIQQCTTCLRTSRTGSLSCKRSTRCCRAAWSGDASVGQRAASWGQVQRALGDEDDDVELDGNKPTLSRFKSVENTNYVVQLGQQNNMHLVGIQGADIVDGKKTLVLGLVWQLMRYVLTQL